MQTNLRTHQQDGPLVIARGEGCRVFDDSGKEYIEAVAGLWCAALGFGSERLAKVAYEQMRELGYYHLYRHRSTEPAIALAEELLKIAPVPMARVVFQCSGSGGAILPPQNYFEKIQEVLRKYDILLLADEVICGFARTGQMWGSQTYGVRPDMVTSAKALSAAMQPISAVFINDRIYEAMLAQSDKFGNFAHGFTYAGHPVAAAVALEVQRIYAEIDIVSRVKRLATLFQ